MSAKTSAATAQNPLLMPQATAVWLIEETPLTFGQIATFTGLLEIEIQALADEEVGYGIVGRNPVEKGELLQEELDKAMKDESYFMKHAKRDLPGVQARSKGPRYTPVSKRGDKPDGVAYLLKHNPEITDAQIVKLVGTTKNTINAVRDRTHANITNIRPRHPVDLGLCTYAELEAASRKGLKAQGKTAEEVEAHQDKLRTNQEQQPVPAEEETQGGGNDAFGGFDFSNFLTSSTSEDDEKPGEI